VAAGWAERHPQLQAARGGRAAAQAGPGVVALAGQLATRHGFFVWASSTISCFADAPAFVFAELPLFIIPTG